MEAKKRQIVIIGFLLVALAYMSIKLSVPALPILPNLFHTRPIYLKLSATLFLISFALTQLIWGGIATFVSRNKLIFISLIISSLGSLLAMLSINVWMFILARIIEGIGLSAASPLCRVLMAEHLEKVEIAKATIFFGIIFNFMPFIAPTFGQYLVIYLGWRYIFAVFLGLIFCYGLYTYFKLPKAELRKVNTQEKFSLSSVLKSFLTVLRCPIYWAYIIPFAIFTGTMIGYYMAIPYWYLVHFHISDRYYTALALFTAIPNIITYYLSRFIIKKHGTEQCMIFAGFSILFANHFAHKVL